MDSLDSGGYLSKIQARTEPEMKENTGIDLTLGKSEQRFARDHLNSLISRELSDFCPEIMEHLHSLGSPEFIQRRVSFRGAIGPP